MSKFKFYPRVRKNFENPRDFIRLHRAEYAHDFLKKKFDENNYYPDSRILIKEISKFYKKKEKNILLGMGAESLIKDTILWHQLEHKNRNALNTYPNFFMYEIFLKLFNYKKTYFKIDALNPSNTNAEEIKKKIHQHKISLLILVNPAHPIEKYWSINEINSILKFAKKKKTFVIIDEVYQGMGSQSCLKLIKNYNNFIIIKSISKTFGYPGLRIGFAIGNEKIIKKIESFRLSHELPSSIISQGVRLFKDYKLKVIPRIKKIVEAREFALKEFKKRRLIINGKYGNSISIFFDNREKLIKLGNLLKRNKIIVNYNYPKPYEKFLNVTTTSIPNIKKFLKFFDIVIND